MRFTPQQSEAFARVAEHIKNPRHDFLLLQGVSGVGKSTLVRAVAAGEKLSVGEIDEWARDFDLKRTEGADIALVDYQDVDQLVGIKDVLRSKYRASILLAHPRFKGYEADLSHTDLHLLNHSEILSAAGFSSDQLIIDVMSPDESVDFALPAASPSSESETLIRHYGLGIAQHIHRLLALRDLDEERICRYVASKLWQILHQAERYHRVPVSRAQALLGEKFQIPREVSSYLRRLSFDEVLSNIITSGISFPYPRHDLTLRLYERIFERGCSRVVLFVPDLPQEFLDELGIISNENCGFGEGRISAFTGKNPLKVGYATRQFSGGTVDDPEFLSRRILDPWVQPVNQSVFPAGNFPLVFDVRAHGGSNHLDSPKAPYALETFLQGRKIPYAVHYDFKGDYPTYVVRDDAVHSLHDFYENIRKQPVLGS